MGLEEIKACRHKNAARSCVPCLRGRIKELEEYSNGLHVSVMRLAEIITHYMEGGKWDHRAACEAISESVKDSWQWFDSKIFDARCEGLQTAVNALRAAGLDRMAAQMDQLIEQQRAAALRAKDGE